MRLYLLRHADAVPHGAPGMTQDAQRPLTDEGRQQAADVGEALRRLKAGAELIVTSPYLRAAQTAEQVRRRLDEALEVRELDALQPDAAPRRTSLALKEFNGHAELLFVGHEPHLSGWLAELVAGPKGLRCDFKKAGVACVEIERVPPPPGSGTLRWFLTPRQLRLIGRAS